MLQWLITRDKYPPLILFILSAARNEILWELQAAISLQLVGFLNTVTLLFKHSTISAFIYIF